MSGKYTDKKWEEFLNEAKERKPSDYSKYQKEFVEYMREYHYKNDKQLSKAHEIYEYAKSSKFFEKFYDHLEDDELERVLRPCKILVITANPIEKAILHDHIIRGSYLGDIELDSLKIDSDSKIKRIFRNNNVYYVFKWGKYWVAHIHQPQTGGYKDLGLFQTVSEALCYFAPNVILSIGVAFGIDYKYQNIGDVIVSKELFPYSENKRYEINNEEIIKPDRSQDKRIDNWLHARFVNSNGFLDGVTYGGVLSGGSVMSSFSEKDRICIAYSKNDFVVGGEMEGSALFQVAPSCNIPCAIIKGICDWGVAKNDIYRGDPLLEDEFKDSLQAYAMQEAVSKCDILFNDKSLFCSSKMKEIDVEKKKNKLLVRANIVSLILFNILLYLSMTKLQHKMDYPLIYLLGAIITALSVFAAFIIQRITKYKEKDIDRSIIKYKKRGISTVGFK